MARKARNIPAPRNKKDENSGSIHIPTIKIENYSAAPYIRLSKEDSGKNNQNTVENQQALLDDYLDGNPDITLYDRYIDNGFSGTNFERPAFMRMMEDVKAGKVNCIIVKDLSRFGRSYLELGNYIEKIFPFFHVRFISITDHYDTHAGETLENSMTIPLKNIINEVYAKDISQKIGSALDMKKQEGRYGGGVAPYGYRKSDKNKGKYEIDEEVAEIVRYIYELRTQELGYCSIVKILNAKGIPSPSAYRFAKGIVKNESMKDRIWKMYAIEDMLRDEVYLGNMVRGKTRSALYKGEKRHHVPREEWIVVKNTHPPIISQELYDKVQMVNDKKYQIHKNNSEKVKDERKQNLFVGKIFCGDCGITMGCARRKGEYLGYYCTNYKENGDAGCRKKHISALKVEKAVLEAIKAHVTVFQQNIAQIQIFNGQQDTVERRKQLQLELKELKGKEENFKKNISDLYLDYKCKLLDVSEYFLLKGQYEGRMAECLKLCEEKKTAIMELHENYGEHLELSQKISKMEGWDTLTRKMIEGLIERVNVYQDHRLEVVFCYLDEFEEILKLQRVENVTEETVVEHEI